MLFSVDQPVDSKSLEIAMSGMSMMSSESVPGRKETASSVESSSPRDHDAALSSQMATAVPSDGSLRGSAPTSPSSAAAAGKGVSRRPGMAAASLPSPIGKPGHSKNTSATSPLLTLTPNSSVDGNSDWHSLGTRHSPPFQTTDVPSLPFFSADHRSAAGSDVASYGSFEFPTENGNDGLLGLEALRDRANSSPGPIQMLSTSPQFARGHLAAHLRGANGNQPIEVPADRPRMRDRPPLSHTFGEGGSHHNDRGGMALMGVSSSRSVGSEGNNGSYESSDSRGFGTIGRADLRPAVSDFEINRRRATSSDSFQAGFSSQPPREGYMDPSHKFGILPTLSSHIQQQRMPDNHGDLQRPRHIRSVSQPMMQNGGMQPLPPGMDPRFFQAGVMQEGHSYSGESKFKPHSGMAPHTLSSSYDLNQYSQQRSSVPSMGYGQQSYPALSRRDALDFQLSPPGSVIAGMEEMQVFGTSSMISPAHSPMQPHYVSHSRAASDAGSPMFPSSPRSLPSFPRSNSAGHVLQHQRHMSSDEDLTHPLVGEHIEVPGDDDPYMSGGFGLGQGLHARHGHSLSMDQLLPQYIETPRHMQTAGAALPMPKVVYSVKFKRTQRNFVLGPRINRDLKIGTYVKVEADRGEDLGIVVGKLPSEKLNFPGRSTFSGLGSPGLGGGPADLKRIIRLATHDEVSLLSMKRDEEDELLKICRAKVRQRGLQMHVVDAEYQFDRHKLTFFFEAEGRVDFRELVRDLFSMYKTRIWMQQLDKNTATSSPAIIAPHPSTLQMDYGVPIIAPVSEFADSIVLGGLSSGDARSH